MQLLLFRDPAAIPIRAFTRNLKQTATDDPVPLRVNNVWLAKGDARIEVALESSQCGHKSDPERSSVRLACLRISGAIEPDVARDSRQQPLPMRIDPDERQARSL